MSRHFLFVVALLAAACSSASGASGGADVAADVAADTAADAVADTLADTAGDAKSDTVAADVLADAAPDAVADAAPDAAADVAADTAADVAADAAADVTGVQCAAGGANAFPSFDRSCAKDADCFVAVHQINCCGTHVAWGLNTSAQAAFAAAEATCESQYPGCGCAAYQTMAEDGYATFDNSLFAATCDAGTCRSSMPSGKPDCQAQGGLASPKPVKACTADSDCSFVFKTIDCCGSQQVIGVTTFAKAAFDKVLQTCNTQISLCDCVGKPTVQEDGTALGANPPVLDCINGQCMTGVWPK